MNHLLKNSCVTLAAALSPRVKILAALRAAWGEPAAKDSYRESLYFDLVRHEFPDNCVDDKT
ncbi:MAG: hypothetical protein OQK79_11170, partial [Rhodanobacter sp.]|nr:hypothetical protein [Rhodanobacter sp.]